MNNADKHIAHWSNTDVQKYLNGELNARQMHDLEQLALDDPFLADALEGLQTQPGQTLQQDLSELRTRLDARVTARPAAIPWRTIRVAAAVVLLVGLGFTAFYTLLDKKQPSTIAKTPAPPAVPNQSAAIPRADTSAPPATASVAPAKTNQLRIAAKRPARRPSASAADAESLADVEPVDKDTARPVATSVTIGADTHLLAFSGRVLDLNQRPLAGASLTYKSSGIVTGAVTDARGQFNLYIPQKDTTCQLTVAREGYQETQYALNTGENTGNTIYLRQNQPELDEVVVSGIGAKRKEFMAEPPSDNPEKLDSFWLNTAPAMGGIAYLNYLATARKTLPVDTTIHGTESISFRVDKKGALTEFRIERSLSPAHDAGVIRLITEGPPWKMLHGRSARALVNVIF